MYEMPVVIFCSLIIILLIWGLLRQKVANRWGSNGLEALAFITAIVFGVVLIIEASIIGS